MRDERIGENENAHGDERRCRVGAASCRFEKAGLTELSIRLFDEPMAGLEIVAKHVLPHFERYEA